MRRKVKEVAKPRKMVVAVFNMGLSFPLYFEREKSFGECKFCCCAAFLEVGFRMCVE